jgi:transglutaminase-like putative cysteine protease
MLIRSFLASLLVAGAALSVAAQAPRVTPKGDPSVNADTIYRLAVDAGRYPEEDAAYLLDDGIVRLNADGRGTRTYRQIVQVLKPGAAERLQEQTFGYSPSHQRLTINWIRVVRADGSIVSDKPSQVQDADVPAETDDPVYSDHRVKRVSLSGVAPGTLVDYSYTTEELKPFLPGDFYDGWSVSTGLQVARSRYIVDLPASVTPRLYERNLNFKRAEQTVNGRHVYTWATANLPRIKPEALAADSNDVFMSVAVSSPTTWQDIARWYAALARPNAVASPYVTSKVDSIVRGARTRTDSIRAIHKWVAQDIRYVAIALGASGYQPRKPDVVVRTGFGDCKDKATLFASALGHLGIQAYPVLLNSSGGVRRDMPSIHQLDHEIAAVKIAGGYQFVDLTADLVPYGDLPSAEQGEFGLVVQPDGASEVVSFPKAPLSSNSTTMHVAVTLDTLGIVNGRYVETASGASQYGLRNVFVHPMDTVQRKNFANAIASRLFEDAEGDSLVVFEGKDLQALPRVTMRLLHGRAASVTGKTMILQMPFRSMGGMGAAAKELTETPRRFPIDAAKFWGGKSSVTEYSITLPDGWHADLPKSVTATSAFGDYVAEYTMQGNAMHLVRRITGATAVTPKEKVDEFASWLRAIATDDAKVIVLTKDAP